jgi:hypothetical protein
LSPTASSQDFKLHTTHEVSDSTAYRAVLDEYRHPDGRQALVGHITFREFTLSHLKQLLQDWSMFRQCVTAPIFAYGGEDDEKWERFVSLLGFQPLSTFLDTQGRSRRLFISLPRELDAREANYKQRDQ